MLNHKQTMAMAQTQRLSNVFEERVRSLTDDQYCLRVRTRLSNIWLARLHHMSNGNDIVIKAYPKENRIIQYTNKIKTHEEVLGTCSEEDNQALLDHIFSRP